MLTLLKSKITKYLLLSGVILLLIGYHYISINNLESKINDLELNYHQCIIDKNSLTDTNDQNTRFIKELQFENEQCTVATQDLNNVISQYNHSSNSTIHQLKNQLSNLQNKLDNELNSCGDIILKDANETYFNQIGK
jgi:archaellum component FlaC